MKTALKIIGIVILVILIIVISLVVLFVIASKFPAVSEDYQNKVKTGGEIEATYIKTAVLRSRSMKRKLFKVSENMLHIIPQMLNTPNGTRGNR